jgi:hypothetical protein
MTEVKRRINYLGWLGEGNLGDEALYKAIKGLFSPFKLVPAMMDLGDHSIVSPITIIGGSTGIPDWIESIRPTHYNYIFGAGVKDPSFYGYDNIFREVLKISVATKRLKIFRGIGVRGDFSKDLLAKWGIQSEVIGDPCFSLQPDSSVKRADDKIAISVGSDGILWGMNEERLIREVAKVCRNLRSEGYELVLLPFWSKNVNRVRKMAKEEEITFFESWYDIQSTLDLIAGCKVLIGEKLHSLGLSAAAGTPFIGLEYQPKCRELAQSVGFENYTIRTDQVSEDKIMKLFNNLSDNYEEMRKQLTAKVDVYQKKQKQFAIRIIRDVESLSEYYWNVPRANRLVKNFFWKTDLFFHEKPALWHAWNRVFFLHAMQYFV